MVDFMDGFSGGGERPTKKQHELQQCPEWTQSFLSMIKPIKQHQN